MTKKVKNKNSEIEKKIVKCFKKSLKITNLKLLKKLRPQAVLLETGLDSLGFAILVSLLDEELGFDPFAEMTDSFYPVYFSEFCELYKNYKPKLKN